MAYALITGASSGIGREMAALFAADRHDLIITARSQGKLDDVKRTLEHRYGVLDGFSRRRLASPA